MISSSGTPSVVVSAAAKLVFDDDYGGGGDVGQHLPPPPLPPKTERPPLPPKQRIRRVQLFCNFLQLFVVIDRVGDFRSLREKYVVLCEDLTYEISQALNVLGFPHGGSVYDAFISGRVLSL